MPVKTPEEAMSFVRTWMNDRKVFKSDISDKNKDNTYFSYEGASGIGINFSVQQPKDLVRVVGVTARLLIDSNQQKAFSDLDAQERNEFLKRLSNNLLYADPTYAVGPNPETPEWILLIKEISYDELTEGRLIDAIDKINRTVISVSSIIIDKLGEPKGE